MLASEVVTIAYDLMQIRGCLTGTVATERRIRMDAEAPSILTQWLFEVFRFGKSYAEYEYNHRPHQDLIAYGYEDQEMTTGTLTITGTGSVKSYTLEVDQPCTVVIEDYDGAWNTLATHTKTTGGTERFSGSVTPTASATQSRIVVTGNYYTILKNYALYSYDYVLVPEYKEFIRIPFPSDCRYVDIVLDECDFEYQGITLDRQGNSFVVDNDRESSVRIVYRPTPTAITALTDTLPVDDVAAMTAPYFLASQFSLMIDPASASYFLQKYQEERDKLREPGINVDIEDAYGGFYHDGFAVNRGSDPRRF